MLDLIIKNARIENQDRPIDIGIAQGRITSIENKIDAPCKATFDADGHFTCSGFFESHIHLDKVCILDRCNIEEGTLDEAALYFD